MIQINYCDTKSCDGELHSDSRFDLVLLYRPMKAGPGCSKLTTSLFNVSLKSQTIISQKTPIFFLNGCEKLLQCKSFSHFSTKNVSVFGDKVVKHLTSRPLNELVKLTML